MADDIALTLPSGLVMSFRRIPAGSFRMGSRGYNEYEEPEHRVCITRDFYLGTYPVTQAEFAAWRPEHEFGFSGRLDHPAEQVSWFEAMEFCRWLTEECAPSLPAGYVVCLPTEAQWEYACRGGSETGMELNREYYTGDGELALAAAGWYDENSGGSTQPVGQLAPNQSGLYDLHGNVEEWCLDAWDAHVYQRRVDGVSDPVVHGDDDSDRVVRGGCWINSPWFCRSAYRFGWWPANRDGDRGFRACLVFGPCPGEEAKPAGGGVASRDDAAPP